MPTGNPRTAEQDELTRLAVAVVMEIKASRSLKWLAETADVDRTMLTHFRDGKKVPTVNEFVRLCEALDVLPSVVVREAEKRRGGGTVVQFPTAPIPPTDDVEERAALGHDVEAELEAGQIEP